MKPNDRLQADYRSQRHIEGRQFLSTQATRGRAKARVSYRSRLFDQYAGLSAFHLDHRSK